MISIPVEQATFLRPSQKQVLAQTCGLPYVHDVLKRRIGPSDLVRLSCGALDVDEAKAIIEVIHENCAGTKLLPLRTLLMHEAQRESRRVATFSRDMDQLLGGGVALGSLTEICGAPGVGKTQVSMQVAVSCFLPQAFGGIGGRTSCWYIDTEGSFISSRYREVASAAVAQVTKIAHQQHWLATLGAIDVQRMREEASAFTVDDILSNTKVSRVCELEAFLGLIHALPSMLASNPTVRLVVVDSIAFPFRSNHTGMEPMQLPRLVFHTGQLLQRACQEFGVGIVVTNQMTTRLHPSEDGSDHRRTELIPALGENWAHCVSTRLVLRAPHTPSVSFCNENGATQVRHAELHKSPTEPRGECSFLICGSGVRNAPPRSH